MAEIGITQTTELTDRQVRVLPYLVASRNLSECARLAQVGLRTLYRWMEDMDFREELDRLRGEAAELAYTELKGLMLKAVHVLGSAMEDANPQVRLRAAQTALSVGLKATELKDIQKRLDLLDSALPLWSRRNMRW